MTSLPVRAPDWIREKRMRLSELHGVKDVMRRHDLSTVCEEARCPNRGECFSRRTATFLMLGDVCTRTCGFCDIAHGKPSAVDPLEPYRLATAAREMGLQFVVLTSVDRDDLPDGGAAHFAEAIRALRRLDPAPGIEVLTPDFQGRFTSLATVIEARPDVFNHNVETVPRLYTRVRRGARLDRSLGLLGAARTLDPSITTKSGFMLGLGEREDEVLALLEGLRGAGVDIVTIGQYLQPSRETLRVEEYVRPERFEFYREAGERLGFRHVFSGPFVRSSYRAEEALRASESRVSTR
ncbi:MAG: lipoyl synthase [Acidobacteria bacterium]|nr:lipoyl synthase [Acidobacteriota bacterium]MCA1609605.1 lipoyl synthase [Acidobacteriota bacterium]